MAWPSRGRAQGGRKVGVGLGVASPSRHAVGSPTYLPTPALARLVGDWFEGRGWVRRAASDLGGAAVGLGRLGAAARHAAQRTAALGRELGTVRQQAAHLVRVRVTLILTLTLTLTLTLNPTLTLALTLTSRGSRRAPSRTPSPACRWVT